MAQELLNDPRTLYQILGVSKDASDQEIKSAYRKKAPRFHPDRNPDDPSALSEFHKLTEAKEILLNKAARKTYDTRGLAAALIVMNPSGAGMSSYGAAVLAFSATERCFILFGITIFFSLIALTPIFISMRSDGSINWDWWVTFVPLWVVELLLIVALLVYAGKYIFGCYEVDRSSSPPDEEDPAHEIPDANELIAKLSRLGLFVLLDLATLQLLIALRLDGVIDVSYFVVLAPWLLLEAVILINRIATLRSTFNMLEAHARQQFYTGEPGEDGVSSSSSSRFFFFVISELKWPLARLVFAFLLALRLDGSLNATYWVVFTPLWVAMGLWALFLFAQYCGFNVLPKPPMPPELQVKAATSGAIEACAAMVCCLAPLTAVAILAAAKAEETTDYSLIFVFVPVLVLSCCCCFAIFCSFCLVTQQRFEHFTGVHVGSTGTDKGGDAGSTASDTPIMSEHAREEEIRTSAGADVEAGHTDADIGDID